MFEVEAGGVATEACTKTYAGFGTIAPCFRGRFKSYLTMASLKLDSFLSAGCPRARNLEMAAMLALSAFLRPAEVASEAPSTAALTEDEELS